MHRINDVMKAFKKESDVQSSEVIRCVNKGNTSLISLTNPIYNLLKNLKGSIDLKKKKKANKQTKKTSHTDRNNINTFFYV